MVSMNKKEKCLPELLAPAGSFEHLKAAILAGADAVYLGGSKFGARAYAQNFSEEELVEAIYYAHLYDRRIYMTVNTLMTDSEMEEELYEFLKPYYEAGLDGVIVQDMGAIAFIRNYFPEMEIHSSTQMTITTMTGAKAAKRMGMNRIVPARELSMEEITSIRDETGLEIEVFVHGALCYCYSGQCLFSSVYGGRSGNRGRCAQPCRLPYDVIEQDGGIRKAQNYILSPKDLCTLIYLPDVIENGLDSLKIEGRMKNTEFVAGVVAIYRKYIDYYDSLEDKSEYHVDPKDMATLEELFSRSGFTDGYFHKHNGREMMSMHLPNHQGRRIGTIQAIKKNQITVLLSDTIHAKDILVIPIQKAKDRDEVILTVPNDLDGKRSGKKVILNVSNARSIKVGDGVFRRKNTEIYQWIENEIYMKDISRPVNVSVSIKRGRPVSVESVSGEYEYTLSGPIPDIATGKPIVEADVKKQMNKTGNSPFFLNNLQIDLDDELFVPISVIKNMRQETYKQLALMIQKKDCRIAKSFVQSNNGESYRKKAEIAKIIVTVYNAEILHEVLQRKEVYGIVIPMDFWDVSALNKALRKIHDRGIQAYLSLPRIIREKEFNGKIYQRKEEVILPWDGYYVHHINEAQLLYDYQNDGIISNSTEIIMTASLYQWNEYSHREVKRLFGQEESNMITEIPMEFDQEDSLRQLKRYSEDISEILLYGRYPVMVSAQCVNKNSKKCTKIPEQFFLKDGKGRKLPVSTHCRECFNMIWTDKPRDWSNRSDEFKYLSDRIRIDLFMTDVQTLDEIIKKINL